MVLNKVNKAPLLVELSASTSSQFANQEFQENEQPLHL